MTYNNDIAHCEGNDCPLASKCRRFQLFKIWGEREKEEYCLTPFVEPSFNNDKCDNFMSYE